MVSGLLNIAGTAVDLIHSEGASVLVSFEGGWDRTTQVVSLIQVMLDPFYRTLEGFETLLRKEWLCFGHRFGSRERTTSETSQSEQAPIFLQFIDCVWQLMRQFPLSFEVCCQLRCWDSLSA